MPTMPARARRAVHDLFSACMRAGRNTPHDRHWRAHPAVRTGDELTLGERAADRMKAIFSTWTALLGILVCMTLWIASGGFGHDAAPFILLNLCLSCLAALQCFILLIAAKRADQIAAAIALHTLENTEQQKQLLQQNTALTEQIAGLTREMHAHIAAAPAPAPETTPETTPDAPPARTRARARTSEK